MLGGKSWETDAFKTMLYCTTLRCSIPYNFFLAKNITKKSEKLVIETEKNQANMYFIVCQVRWDEYIQ